jgi:hypothetical protein
MTGRYYLDGVGHPEAIAAYTASFAPTLNQWRSFTAEASAAAGASFLSMEGERGARRDFVQCELNRKRRCRKSTVDDRVRRVECPLTDLPDGDSFQWRGNGRRQGSGLPPVEHHRACGAAADPQHGFDAVRVQARCGHARLPLRKGRDGRDGSCDPRRRHPGSRGRRHRLRDVCCSDAPQAR